MKQIGMGTGFEKYTKTTRREQFLAEMERIVPWLELCARIVPHYPKAGDGRPPKDVEMMLRIYFLQQWFNLSDPGVEEALYDSRCMQAFAGIDLSESPVPDESTLCRFRHLLERHELGRKLFEQVHEYLQRQGIKVSCGTIVDATIINAPSSTKNQDKKRDPEMRQTKKGNQWYFGMKAHVGVDRARLSTRSLPPQPTFMTRPACPTCCTGRKLGCGATRLTAAKARSSDSSRRKPRISPIAVIAARVSLM